MTKRNKFYQIGFFTLAIAFIALCLFVGITAIQKQMKLNMSFQINPSVLVKIEAKGSGEAGYTTIFQNSGETTIKNGVNLSGNTLSFGTDYANGLGTSFSLKITNLTSCRVMAELSGASFSKSNLAFASVGSAAQEVTVSAVNGLTMNFSQVFAISKGSITNATITPKANVYAIDSTYYVKQNEEASFTLTGSGNYDTPAQGAIGLTSGSIKSYSDGTLTLNTLTSDTTITINNTTGKTYTVTKGTLTGFAWGTVAGNAQFNTDYTFTLVLQDGYKIDGATVQAVIGGNTYDCSQTGVSATTYTFKLAGASITGNVTINAVAQEEAFYKVYQYGTTGAVDNNRAYYAKNSRYKYYIEMGEYPQTMVSSADVTSLGLSTNLQKEGDYYKQGDNYYAYVGSPDSTYASGFTQWYKVEPIRWIVLGGVISTTDGSSAVAFNPTNDVTYNSTNKTFTYSGTAYSKVLLIAEQALKNNVYDSSSSDKAWQSTGIYSFLNTTLMPTIFTETQQGKILGTTLYTGRYSVGGNGGFSTLPNTENGTSTANKLFLLGAGRDVSTDGDDGYTKYATENYRVSTYFRDATARYGGTSVANVTDYARASGAYWYESNKSSYWWLRSGRSDYNDYAYHVRDDGDVVTFSVDRSNCAVRPSFVLNLA